MKTRTIISVGASLLAAGFGVAALAQPDDGGVMERIRKDGSVPVAAFAQAAEARARAMDANGDGAVSSAEIRAHHEQRRAERAEKRFPDANDDGVVSEAEFLDAARARFERLDANADGVIARDEMPKNGRRHGEGGRRG